MLIYQAVHFWLKTKLPVNTAVKLVQIQYKNMPKSSDERVQVVFCRC